MDRHVKDLMNPHVVYVDKATSLEEAADIMAARKIGCLVVVQDGKPVGILTERHFVERFSKRHGSFQPNTVGEIMATPPITVNPETTISRAMYWITKHRIKRMPVIQDGRLVGLITYRDLLLYSRSSLVQLVNRTKELQHEASLDPLTGFYNKRHFQTKVGEEFERAGRTGRFSSLIFLDLDHFKLINDTYTHLAGDYVLETVANIFRHNTRRVDLIARYGGEEFVIIDPSEQVEQAVLLAEKLREVVEGFPFSFKRHKFNLTLSAGICSLAAGKDYKEIIDLADKAMYHSKQNGRNRVSYWDPHQNRMVTSRYTGAFPEAP